MSEGGCSEGRTAIVTGSTSGIGVVDGIRSTGGQADFLPVDVGG
ncbi:MAG: hypothetical protein JWN20_1494, partial [Jatrophihabitantaceae bacterium]|nr:hypothetical protein [Jatrophihabitantaceae bacterium]